MANNVAKFVIDVTSRGLKAAKQGIGDIGRGLKDLATSHRDASRAAGEHYSRQEKGVIGTANSTRSFSKLAQTIGDGGGGLVGAYATLAANIFAVTAAFNALRSAAQVEQVFLGLEAAGNRAGLTLSITAKNLRDVAGAAVSMEQAMRTTSQVFAAGFNQDELLRLGQVARDTSFALGRNLTDSMDRLTRGIVKLEPELLDELGIMTKIGESNALYAQELGKTVTSLTNMEKRQGFLNAVLAEGQLKFGGLSEAAGNTTAYDKLAATFSDLVKVIFNAFNVVGKPLAAFFSETKAGLAGLMILLGATIRSQLMPRLSNLSKTALAAADDMKTTAETSLKTWSQSAKIDGHKTFISNLVKGNTTIEERQKKLQSLTNTINKLSAAQEKVARQEAAGKQFSERQQQQIFNRETRLASAEETRKRLLEYASASSRAGAKGTAANAIDQAAGGSIRAGMGQLIKSFQEYGSTTDAAGKKTGAFSRTMFMMTNSVQFATTAFLRLLPWIGMATVAIGAFMALLAKTKSAEQIKLNKVTEEYNEILESQKKKLDEIRKIQGSNASIAARTIAEITARSNMVSELTDKYREMRQAAKDAEDAEKAEAERRNKELKRTVEAPRPGSGGVYGVGTAQLTSRAFDQDRDARTGIIATEKLYELQETLARGKKLGKDSFGEQALKQLEALRNASPATVDALVKLRGGYDALAKLPAQAALDQVNSIIAEVPKYVGDAAQAIETLRESFKQLETATSDFLRAAGQTTAYDKVVDAAQNAVDAMIEMQSAMSLGGDVNWRQALTSIGKDTQRFLTDANRATIQRVTQNDIIVRQLEAQEKSGDKLNSYEQQRLNTSRAQIQAEAQNLELVAEGVFKMQQQFAAAQNLERIGKSQVALAQAQLQANSRNYDITAEGVKARIEDEERITRMQVDQLKSQKAIIDAALAQNKLSQEQIKMLQEYNTLAEINGLIERKNHEERIHQRNVEHLTRMEQLYLEDQTLTDFEKGQLALQKEYIARSEQNMKAAAQTLNDFRGARSSAMENAALEASSQALQNQISAMLAGLATVAEKAAKIEEKTNEILRDRLTQLAEQRNMLQETINTEKQLAVVRSGRRATLSSEIEQMKESHRLAKEKANQEYTAARNRLETDRKSAAAENAVTEGQKSARSAAIAYYDTQIQLLEQGREIQMRHLDATHALAIEQKLVFDVHKEGLELQKESLENLLKQVEVARELANAERKVTDLRDEVDRKRRGIKSTPEMESALQIEAAMEAYRLAVQEAGIRKATIDLEFALIDAQRQLLVEQIRDRKLAMGGRNGIADAQMDAAIANLMSADISKVAENAKRAVDRGVEAARLELEREMLPDRNAGDLISRTEGIRRRYQARRDAARMLANPPAEEALAASIVLPPALQQRSDAQLKAYDGVIDANRALIDKIDEWIKAVEKALGAAPSVQTPGIDTTAPTAITAAGNARTAMEFFLSKGWTAAQAAGIVGNLQAESGAGLNTRAEGDKQRGQYMARGIAQWRIDAASGARALKFKEIMGIDVLQATLHQQLQFVQWELEHTYRAAAERLRKATDAGTAAIIVDKYYEQSSGAHRAKRIGNANALVSGGGAAAAAAPAPRAPTAGERTALAYAPPAAANDNTIADLEQTEILVTAIKEKIPFLQLPPFMANPPATTLEWLDEVNLGFDHFRATFEKLGEQGQIMISIMDGVDAITKTIDTNLATVLDSGAKFTDRIAAGAAIATQVITSVSSILQASSDARIATIDKEIAAEQKRDGKSAESQAKIEALEKRKDAIARKSFNTQKKLMMAQAVVSTAAAVANALATPLPWPAPAILAGIAGAMGAAQLAIIASTSYQSSAANVEQKTQPSTLTIGKRGDSVDLARNNPNVGGELGYLRGAKGRGTNSSNYAVIGSAYGGGLPRGYGNAAFAIGEKGPEILTPDAPISVRPMNDNEIGKSVHATFHVQALDVRGVEELLYEQRGNVIGMLREAANAEGSRFMEDVNINVHNRPNKTGATRI